MVQKLYSMEEFTNPLHIATHTLPPPTISLAPNPLTQTAIIYRYHKLKVLDVLIDTQSLTKNPIYKTPNPHHIGIKWLLQNGQWQYVRLRDVHTGAQSKNKSGYTVTRLTSSVTKISFTVALPNPRVCESKPDQLEGIFPCTYLVGEVLLAGSIHCRKRMFTIYWLSDLLSDLESRLGIVP